jgi:hypothetical protein
LRKLALGAVAPFLLAVTVMAQTGTTSTAKPATKPVPPLPTAAGPNQPTPPAHPLTAIQAHELMKLTGTDQIKTRLVENIMAYFQRAFPPFVPADVRTDLQTSLNKMDIDTPTVATYQKYLSTEDATQVIAFYRTTAGKHLLEVTPLMMGEIQKSALANGQETARAVIERHKAEIEAAQKAYEAQHPRPSAPTLGAPTPAPAPSPRKPQ